uniref:UDP-N-acetylglucosamine 2-epimerase n=1 Tax=Flavobacterium sp. TaxID=239 RepID=UPI00404951B8
MNKRIAVFTSIRSEYGILTPVLKKLRDDPNFSLELIVAGAHLSKLEGYTVNQIIDDGFEIHKTIKFLKYDNGLINYPVSVSILTRLIGEYFRDENPDAVLILGDRFELLPVASMAVIYNIPIIHLSGGDITLGAIDNSIRNAITKMASLHFVTSDNSLRNVLKMDENSNTVFNVGEPFLDILSDFNPISKFKLFYEYDLDPNEKLAIVTFHPETIDNNITPEFLSQLLDRISQSFKFQILITGANFDMGGYDINSCFRKLAKEIDGIKFVDNLGQIKYYSFLTFCEIVIGNSSSGIIEVQSFNKPVLNIGNRQAGRLLNPNVVNSNVDVKDCLEKLGMALSEEFRKSFFGKKNVYGDGNASQSILKILNDINWNNFSSK